MKMVKNCGNCKYAYDEGVADGTCMNVYGIEGQCSEIGTNFVCDNWEKREEDDEDNE